MTQRLDIQIKEFCIAATNPHSYNIPKNPYTWFGFLWGMQIPVLTFSLYYLHNNQSLNILVIWRDLPTLLRWSCILYPIILTAIFGILGTIRYDKNKQIKNLIDELQYSSITDPLTGLYNRRHFTHVFHDDVARTSRSRNPLSVIFLDIDNFKRLNDEYGHATGDNVLIELAKILKANSRPYDTPARWGGEEFVLLIPNVKEKEAAKIAERIRIESKEKISEIITTPTTISAGIAEYDYKETFESFIDKSDQALYSAKQAGKNKVVRWSTIKDGI